MTTTTAHPPVAPHAHHPNYMAVFIWLVVLTAIEVGIPEFIHIPGAGHDPMLPTVVAPVAAQEHGEATEPVQAGSEAALAKAAIDLSPNQSHQLQGHRIRVLVLSILAIIKAALVGMFFMHLKLDGWRLNVILAMPTALFIFIIIMLYPDISVHWPQLY